MGAWGHGGMGACGVKVCVCVCKSACMNECTEGSDMPSCCSWIDYE